MTTGTNYWRWFVTVLTDHRERFVKALRESNLVNLRRQIDDLGNYDLHNILRQEKEVEWNEWHLNIKNDKVIDIAEEFHKNFKNIKESSSIINQVDIIEKTFLKFMPQGGEWTRIIDYFKQAREQDNPILIVTAYTRSIALSRRLNTHSAVNTYHALKLYCTLLNCPILAQTQEYTEAFTRILFHPKLDGYIFRNGTVYRGIRLGDRRLVENYKEGQIIITTTFLSTTRNRNIADIFRGTDVNIANDSSGVDPNVLNGFSGMHANMVTYFNRRGLGGVNRFSHRDLNEANRSDGTDLNVTNRSNGAGLNVVDCLGTTNPNPVNCCNTTVPEHGISIFCTYNINNTSRRTALDISGLSNFQYEEEVLILRYVPFVIKSVTRTDDGRYMEICFDEFKENDTVEITPV